MDHFNWSGYWDTLRHSLQKKYHFLSDEDLRYEKGKEAILINTLKRKFNASSSQINDLLFLHLICAKSVSSSGESCVASPEETERGLVFQSMN